MILWDRKRGLGAYMNADTTAKVGFRPYLLTDPHGAAQLSGLGQGRNPFKPQAWYLHGAELGQLRPLDPWVLYPDNPIERLSGLGGLGQGGDVTAQAADELLHSGHITEAEHDAILDGSMSFQDVVGMDPTDTSSWSDVLGQLRQANTELAAIEQQLTDAAAERRAAGVMTPNPQLAQLAQDVSAHRQQYESVVQEFVRFYTLLLGSAPTGISGLGFAVAVWVAGAAVAAVVALLTAYAIHAWSKNVDVKGAAAATAQTEATTTQQLAAQLALALARGDTTTATMIASVLKARGVVSPGGAPSSDFATWVQTNALWLGLGIGGLIVLGPLAQGLFGRRR